MANEKHKKDNPTIIVVKKVKKAKHDHHGGSWKVAFADFMTALFVLFLVMWIMASTSQEQKESIAGYFKKGHNTPTGGTTQSTVTEKNTGTSDSIINLDTSFNLQEELSLSEQQEIKNLNYLLKQLEELINNSASIGPYRDQIKLDMTTQGLRIQIFDNNNNPMFPKGDFELKPYVKKILFELIPHIRTIPNLISISGHTDAQKFYAEDTYSNWELSADRANATRRTLVNGGIEKNRIGCIIGLGDSVLWNKEDPSSSINRRISLILLTGKSAKDMGLE